MTVKSKLPSVNVKKATIADVARLAGVATSTASSALNGKNGKYSVAPATQKAVLQAARELDFEPNPHARRLNGGRCSDMVALFALRLDLGVVTRKLQILQSLLHERGYQAPIHICGDSIAHAKNEQVVLMRNLRLQQPLAIVCNSVNLHETVLEELQRYVDEGGITICYDTPVDISCDNVIFDRNHSTYIATKHLLGLGHRKIGFYGDWPNPDPDRFAGFQRALHEFSVPFSEEWMFATHTRKIQNEQFGALLAEDFLELKNRPSALCIMDDAVAAAFIAAVQQHGIRVPQDVSIVGQDDMPVGAFVSPVPLTTVAQPLEEIGREVMRLLQERTGGEYSGPQRRVLVRGELIQRHSTAQFQPATSG